MLFISAKFLYIGFMDWTEIYVAIRYATIPYYIQKAVITTIHLTMIYFITANNFDV